MAALQRSWGGRGIRQGVAALCALLATVVQAQAWPEGHKSIQLVVGNAAGGGTDVVARILGAQLQRQLQHTVVVDNRPAASGTLAVSWVARAPHDGHTLLISPITLVTTPHVMGPATGASAVNVLTDVQPVVQISEGTLLLMAPMESNARAVRSLLQGGPAGGSVSYGTPGTGTPMHIAGELLQRASGLPLTHVPYKGVAPALSDLLGGHVGLVFSDLASAKSYIDGGKLRAVGVTQAQRSPLLPQVPTLTEQGLPVALNTWFGVFAPAGLAPAQLQAINQAFNQALAAPPVQQALRQLGEVPVGGAATTFAQRVQRDFAQFGEQVQAFGIRQP